MFIWKEQQFPDEQQARPDATTIGHSNIFEIQPNKNENQQYSQENTPWQSKKSDKRFAEEEWKKQKRKKI